MIESANEDEDVIVDLPENVEPSVKVSHRQLKLLQLENPLSVRFGNAFFRSLPAQPGVYFFHSAQDQLLYIGQSNDLRARVGSYRHVTPEQHPKRTLRLVSKIVRIHWEVCATAVEAVERERLLLLEHRPPFNRAGVWQGDPWWLKAEATDDRLELELSRTPTEHNQGPFPPAFRYVFGALVRGVYRLSYPERPLASYPHGLAHAAVPLSLSLSLTQPAAALMAITAFLTGQSEELLAQLAALPLPPSVRVSVGEQEYWLDDLDRLHRYRAKPPPSSSSSSSSKASPQPPHQRAHALLGSRMPSFHLFDPQSSAYNGDRLGEKEPLHTQTRNTEASKAST